MLVSFQIDIMSLHFIFIKKYTVINLTFSSLYASQKIKLYNIFIQWPINNFFLHIWQVPVDSGSIREVELYFRFFDSNTELYISKSFNMHLATIMEGFCTQMFF